MAGHLEKFMQKDKFRHLPHTIQPKLKLFREINVRAKTIHF